MESVKPLDSRFVVPFKTSYLHSLLTDKYDIEVDGKYVNLKRNIYPHRNVSRDKKETGTNEQFFGF